MRRFLPLLLLVPALARAGEIKYPVSAIPEELTKGVNAVVRHDEMVFTIVDKGRATQYVRMVVTIFNESAKRYAVHVEGYDKLSKVTQFEGATYDALGNQVKKLKSSDIYDQSAWDGFSLYSDNRFKAADLSYGSYPYTVEFITSVELKYLYHIPSSYILPGEKVAVERAVYTLSYPVGLKPRSKVFNTSVQPTVTLSGSAETATWEWKNLGPIKIEPQGPLNVEQIPYITAAPSGFEYADYVGKMDSWKEFGDWISSLNRGRDVLPESTRSKIADLTRPFTTTEEKVRTVYQYVQQKTRYVSIQLGIGGYQPFEARVVDETGYGDCKALSNYTVALLGAAGIRAHYTLVMAGDDRREMDEDFPSSQFNHVIVSVPNGKDTLWLECTSQTNPFGYMGTFTGNRKALAITPEGARIVSTPRYDYRENVQSRAATVTVQSTGDARALVRTIYSGLQYENDHLNFVLDDPEAQKKWIQRTTSIPNFDVNKYEFENHKNRIPSAVVSLDLTLRKYATVSGKRIFVTPNLMNRSTFVPEAVENRKTPVIRRLAYTDLDTVHFAMPDGLYPEFLPQPVKISSRFGEYEASFRFDDKGLLYVRRMKMLKGTFPAESYQEMIDFYKAVNKADNAKIVFLNKT
jgi:transglutaminase-like putative cysteine protease